MTQETKLGLFVLVGIFALVLSVALLGDFQFQRRYNINILFNDIAGLPAKAKVKIAGVEVGAVKNITLEGNKAKVKIWVKHEIKVHRNARASIVSTGIIGSKYLELTSGLPESGLLRNEDVLDGIDPVSFDEIVQEAMEQINKLVSTFKGPEGENFGKNLSKTINNIRVISDSLRVAISDQESELVEIVKNFNTFSRDLAEITSQNKESIKIAMDKIGNAADKLDIILGRIDKGEGTIGKLFSDEKMSEDLKETFADLKETSKEAKRVMKRINLIETNWDYKLRYDTKYEVARHDVGLKISPKPGKYYFLGVSNAGEKSDITSNDPERLNTVNFLIGKQFSQSTELYAGVIRTSGGVGAKIKPFSKWEPWRKLEFTAEGYNFFRKSPVAKPTYNVGANVEVTRWARIGAQIEDPYHESNMNAYVNVVLKDDDIGYILGLVGLARP